jgi:hypothetical protein
MSTTNTNARREAIQTLLAVRAGSANDASALAQATVDRWRDLTSQLAPVIGAGGVKALFGRAVQKASANYPWLAIPLEDGTEAALLLTLKARFAGEEVATVEKAIATVLLNFVELLATLIGESLTVRLLGPAWGPATLTSEREMP